MPFKFQILLTSNNNSLTNKTSDKEASGFKKNKARIGKITTPHGEVLTPNFIFCATKASIKAIPTVFLKKLGVQFVLGNVYHLMLRPGGDIIRQQGGLHKFMVWNGPLLSDSGGYQIFAMGHGSVAEEIKRKGASAKSLIKITEAGAFFKSYVNGEKVFLSPEKSAFLQHQFGVDIAVQLDECTAFHISKEATQTAMLRSMRWGDRSLYSFRSLQGEEGEGDSIFKDNYFVNTDSAFFSKKQKKLKTLLEGTTFNSRHKQQMMGVVQGGIYSSLRKQSAEYVCSRPYFYIGIGGSLGRNMKEMQEVIENTMELVNSNKFGNKKPVHLLGIGDIQNIFNGVKQGIDTFDCVLPTRVARHGHAIVPAKLLEESSNGLTAGSQYILNVHNACNRSSTLPLDYTQKETLEYSRGYLHHLLKAKEISAMVILSMHNIAQMCRLFAEIRGGINKGTLCEVEKFWLGEKK